MGRPLKKSLFGANAKNNLKVQFYNGTESKQGYIVKQVGSRRFKCADAAGHTAICKLVNKTAATLTAGEMTITVKLDTGAIAHVQKISSKLLTVYAVNGGNPARYPWNFSTSTTDKAVQVEEAGISTTVISTSTQATNLEGDIEV